MGAFFSMSGMITNLHMGLTSLGAHCKLHALWLLIFASQCHLLNMEVASPDPAPPDKDVLQV